MKTTAERLKYVRAEKGWTQSLLAVAAEVSPGTIGNIESGARQSKGSLPQIAEALGVHHKWLISGKGNVWTKSVEPTAAWSSTSQQAKQLALLFDQLPTDLILRAVVFNQASATILRVLQDGDAPQIPVK